MSLAAAVAFAVSCLASLSLQAVKVAATKLAVIKPANFSFLFVLLLKSRKNHLPNDRHKNALIVRQGVFYFKFKGL